MLRFFEKLVDPYTPYDATKTPPNKVVPFVFSYLAPFRWILALNALTAVAAASTEVYLIYYIGRLVDVMANLSPQAFWASHGFEVALVVAFILILRPAIVFLDMALIKNCLQPHIAALGRWRAHNHMLKQPVGWFESDFAGRIANRAMYPPASIGELTFTTMSVLAYAVAYVVGAMVLLAGMEWHLVIPLILWLILYVILLRLSLVRIRQAARRTSGARSRTLGYVVDAYTNIQSVKLFDHYDNERAHMTEIFDNHLEKYAAENRNYTWAETAV